MAAQTQILAERLPLTVPLQVRGVTVPNRIAMAPMTRGFSPQGIPPEGAANYYARRALGGVGLILTEGVGIPHPSAVGDAGLGENDIPVMYGDGALARWKIIVDAVHAAGSVIIPQLWHQGVMRVPGTGPFPEAQASGPSGYWGPLGKHSMSLAKVPENPQFGSPMSDREIQDVVDAFTAAARNAVSVGFDGVALHGGHGYLLDNFLWSGTNFRDDRWGGNRQRRSEAIVAILKSIRGAIGPMLPIVLRYSQWRMQDYTSRLADTPDELAEIVAPIADAGVDILDPSVRYFDTPAFAGSELTLAGWTKKLTGKLTMAVGGVGLNKGAFGEGTGTLAVDNLGRAVSRFNRGEYDILAVGRALIGDAEWARKALAGLVSDAYDPNLLEKLD